RNILLIERLPEAHQQIDDLNLAGGAGGVASDDLQWRPGDTQIDVPRDIAGGRAAILGMRLTKQRKQDFAIDDNLELLGGVIRPDVHHVKIALNFVDVIENEIELLTFIDLHLDDVRGRALDFEQAVRPVILDGDRRLGADDDGVTLVLDLALVVRVADR